MHSLKRKSIQLVSDFFNSPPSIWNSYGQSDEKRQAFSEDSKKQPEDNASCRDGQTNLSRLFSCSQSKAAPTTKVDTVRDNHADSINHKHILEPWIHFCRESSCHGFKNFQMSHSRPLSMLWLLITLGMAGCLLYTVVSSTIGYYDYGTVTRTEVMMTADLEFPSVTICNICPYKSVSDGNVSNPIEVLMARTSVLKSNVPLDEEDPDYQEALKMSSLEIQKNYSYKSQELIKFANYEGMNLNQEEDFEVVNTQYGRCFTFNGPNYIKKKGVRKVTFAGRSSGLRVLAQIWQKKYLIMDDMTAGIRVYVAQHPETPRIDKDGIDMHPGTATKLALTPTKSKFLPEPYTSYGSEPCQETEKMDLTYKMYDAPFYSYTACIDQCQDLHAARNCSCHTATLYVKHLPPCTVEQDFFCFKVFKNQLINNRMTVECDCPRPCSSFSYSTTITASQMPSRESAKIVLEKFSSEPDDPDELEELRDDYVDMRIYLDTDKVTEILHEPEYTFTSMLAYLGGQMGFFLGASLVTVTELVETISLWLYLMFRKKVVGVGQMEKRPEKTEAEQQGKDAGKNLRRF